MVLRANAGRLLVHQVASEITRDSAALARSFRGPGAFVRGDQLVRAALSIVANIAEACGRGSVPEFRRFLLYARGSAHELRAQLRVARLLDPNRKGAILRLESRTTLVVKLLSPACTTIHRRTGRVRLSSTPFPRRRPSTSFLDAVSTAPGSALF